MAPPLPVYDTKGKSRPDLVVEIRRLENLLGMPLVSDFLPAVEREAAHQLWRWGEGHDGQKEPDDWFWTLGYLAGKALSAHRGEKIDAAKHHLVTSAALLLHWFRRVRLS